MLTKICEIVSDIIFIHEQELNKSQGNVGGLHDVLLAAHPRKIIVPQMLLYI